MAEKKKYLGEIDEGILWAEQSLELPQFWIDKRRVSLDKQRCSREADYYYLVSVEKHSGSNKLEPYWVIEFYNTYRDDPPDPFGNYLVRWHDFLVVANRWCLHGVDLRTFETRRYPEYKDYYVDQYYDLRNGEAKVVKYDVPEWAGTKNDLGWFDHFHQIDGYLLVTDETDIYCFDKNFTPVWKTGMYVGHEGVSIIGHNKGLLEVRGEDESCGHYFLSTVDIKTGDVDIKEYIKYNTEE